MSWKKFAGSISTALGAVGGGVGGFLVGGPVGAAIGAGIGGTLGNAVGGPITQDDVNKQNIKNEWSLLNYQNDYNSPKAQMARYVEANLNPNLIYGQQNLSASANMPEVKGHQADLSVLQAALSLANIAAQNDLLEEQAEKVDQQTETEVYKSAAARAEAALKQYQTDLVLDTGLSPGIIAKTIQPHTQRYNDRSFPVEVYDDTKPALGSNVKSVHPGRKFIWWPF